LKLPPRPNPLGRSLRQALNAAEYWLRRLDRLAELPPVVVELVDPPAPRRPKPAEATLAGTPWLSRHWVNLARAAGVEPDEPVEPDGALGAVVEEAEEEVLVLPPPHAEASRATPISGRAMKRPARFRREDSRCISVTYGVQTIHMKPLSEMVKSFLRTFGSPK
jgi:hypothetical protein